jgi:translation initiation factor 2 beta subunit (eIF-2beta)/eIF-5
MVVGREIEKKFIVDLPIESARFRLDVMYPIATRISGSSTDTFWTQPGVDFVRLRKNTNELTIKVTDKATIEDRVEENVEVMDYETTKRFCNRTFGTPRGEIEKAYLVIFLDDAILSLYTVEGREQVYLEVEAKSLEKVNEIAAYIEGFMPIKQEMRSLYQIVFGE